MFTHTNYIADDTGASFLCSIILFWWQGPVKTFVKREDFDLKYKSFIPASNTTKV